MALERKMATQLGASDNVVDNTNSDFSKWKVPQLKKYLQDRGISCSDHKKSTLIELCTKSDESIAQELYNNLYKEHNTFSFKKSGLVISVDYPFLGASPDGIACCDCCGQRVVEIKCPYSHKEKSVEDICSERGYHLEMQDGQVSCRSLSPWYTQMQLR